MRLYHNPRCSKSRQAVAFLIDAGIEFEEYRYLNEGIDSNDLELLSTIPNILRTKDVVGEYSFGDLDSASIQQILNEQPKSLERPVLIHNGHAILGRPPERLLEYLNNQ